MRGKDILFYVLALLSVQAQSAVITPAEALERLNGSALGLSRSGAELSHTFATSDGTPAVYAFDFGAKTVFASADDLGLPMLGYTDSGNFCADNMPPALEYMMECYAADMQCLRSGARSAESDIQQAAIAPLIKTKWNQDAPYNGQCPKNGYTGCVITAYAQICYYYQFPSGMTGQGKIYDRINNQTLTKDLAEFGTFDYSKMQETYDDNASVESKEEVAKLMAALGYAMEAQYEKEWTGAYTGRGEMVLMRYGYNAGAKWHPRNSYSRSDWEGILYSNLEQGHPIPYTGNPLDGAGHAFILDGYDGAGYFHINWGWGGLSDGYFAIPQFNPSDQGIGGNYGGFAMEQIAALDFYPAPEVEADRDFYIAYDHPFRLSEYDGNKETKGYKIQIIGPTHQVRNYSLYDGKFYFEPGVEITKLGGEEVYVDTVYNTSKRFSFTEPDYLHNSAATLYMDLPDGVYELKPVWHNTTVEGTHPIHCAINTPQSQIMTITDGYATYTDPELYANWLPKAQNVKITSGETVNSKATISCATLINDTDVEFYGSILGVMVDDKGEIIAKSSTEQILVADIPPHSQQECSMMSVFTDLTVGDEYNFAWAVIEDLTQDKYQVISEPVKTIVAAESSVATITLLSMDFNQEGIVYDADKYLYTGIDASNFDLTISLQNNTGMALKKWIYMAVYDGDGDNLVAELNYELTELSAKEPTTYHFTGDYSKVFLPDQPYLLAVAIYETDWVFLEPYYYFYPSVASAIKDVACPADAVGVEYYNLQGVKVSKPARGIFIRLTRYADGSTKINKIKI